MLRKLFLLSLVGFWFWAALFSPHHHEFVDALKKGAVVDAAHSLRIDVQEQYQAAQQMTALSSAATSPPNAETSKPAENLPTIAEALNDLKKLKQTNDNTAKYKSKLDLIADGLANEQNDPSPDSPHPASVTAKAPPPSPQGPMPLEGPHVTVPFESKMLSFCEVQKEEIRADLGLYVSRFGAIEKANYLGQQAPPPEKILRCRFRPYYQSGKAVPFFTIWHPSGIKTTRAR